MNKQFKNKFPAWCNDDNTYDLCSSDDIDSVLVENFLRSYKGYETKFFYDFDMLYIEKGYKQQNSIIGCDIDFTKGKCWGNHVTALNTAEINKDSANLNNIEGVTRANYTDKFAGSTIIQVLSYYDYDISNLSEEGKMLLLCIDSNYLGFYTDRFHETQKKWLVDVLEYPELYDIILKYEEQDFINLARKYNIKIPRPNRKDRDGKVWINEDGYLETEIDLENISKILGVEITLPNCQFELFFKEKKDEAYLTLQSAYAKTNLISSREQLQANIISYSQTFTNSASFTYLKKVNP